MNILVSFTAFILGLLLFSIILYNNKKTTAKLLAFFIFTIAFTNLLNFLWAGHYFHNAPNLLYIGPLVAYLRVPCLFFYVLFLFNEKRVLGWKDSWHLIPAAIYFISFSPHIFSYSANNQSLIEYMYPNNRQTLLFVEGWIALPRIHIVIKGLVTILYIILLIDLWKKYRPHIPDNVSNNRQILNWIKIMIAIFIINGILGIIVGFYPSAKFIWLVAIWRTFSYCGVIYLGLFFLPNILYGTAKVNLADPVIDKLKTIAPTGESASLIKSRIAEFIAKEGYLQKQIKLADLANQIGVQPYILSAYINQVYQLRFNDFINFYRIQFISEGLLKGEWGQLTLEAIGEKAGFTNRTTFLNAFKKYKGTTPTLFLHQYRFNKQQQDQKSSGQE